MAPEATLYEAMYILDARLSEDEQAQAAALLRDAIVAGGGEFVSDELFGRRRLAYPIAGHVEGVYRVMYFRGGGAVAEDVKHQFTLIEPVVRGMVVVANPQAIFSVTPPRQAEETSAAEGEGIPVPAAETSAPETPAEEAPTTEALPEQAPEEAAVEEPVPEASEGEGEATAA